MNQTYSMAQRLMNELRGDVEGQMAQIVQTFQSQIVQIADEIQRGFHAQDLQLRSSMQELAESFEQDPPKDSANAALTTQRLSDEDAVASVDLTSRVAELEKGFDRLRRLLLAMKSEMFGMDPEQEDDGEDGDSDEQK